MRQHITMSEKSEVFRVAVQTESGKDHSTVRDIRYMWTLVMWAGMTGLLRLQDILLFTVMDNVHIPLQNT
jgi:hypothetical protein